MALQTEFEFTLPRGYVDKDGNLHKKGVMRLATAKDEIIPLRDPRVRENEAYLTVLLLSRVVTRLGRVAEPWGPRMGVTFGSTNAVTFPYRHPYRVT